MVVMSRKKTDRWKNWQPPEKFWWKPEKPIPDEIIKACHDEQNGMALAEKTARKVAYRVFQYQNNEQAIQDIADQIIGYGYYLALRDYKPDRGAKFKTFLYHVLFMGACHWNGRYQKKFMNYAKNHVTLICKGNVDGNSRGIFWEEEGIPFRGYTILHFNRFICSPLLITNDGKSKQFMESNQHDVVKYQCVTLDKKTMCESIELLHKVRDISDAEFQTINRRYLPVMYRKMTDAKLRGALSLLDVKIFKMAITINCERGYTKTMIQKRLGIKRDFLQARFMAILKRLDIPYESAIRWYKNHKIFKRKRERKKKSPPQSENP